MDPRFPHPTHSAGLHAQSLLLINTHILGSSPRTQPAASMKQQSQRDYELPRGKNSADTSSSFLIPTSGLLFFAEARHTGGTQGINRDQL